MLKLDWVVRGALVLQIDTNTFRVIDSSTIDNVTFTDGQVNSLEKLQDEKYYKNITDYSIIIGQRLVGRIFGTIVEIQSVYGTSIQAKVIKGHGFYAVDKIIKIWFNEITTNWNKPPNIVELKIKNNIDWIKPGALIRYIPSNSYHVVKTTDQDHVYFTDGDWDQPARLNNSNNYENCNYNLTIGSKLEGCVHHFPEVFIIIKSIGNNSIIASRVNLVDVEIPFKMIPTYWKQVDEQTNHASLRANLLQWLKPGVTVALRNEHHSNEHHYIVQEVHSNVKYIDRSDEQLGYVKFYDGGWERFETMYKPDTNYRWKDKFPIITVGKNLRSKLTNEVVKITYIGTSRINIGSDEWILARELADWTNVKDKCTKCIKPKSSYLSGISV